MWVQEEPDGHLIIGNKGSILRDNCEIDIQQGATLEIMDGEIL